MRRNPSQPGETAAEDIANVLQILEGHPVNRDGALVIDGILASTIRARLMSALRKLRDRSQGYRSNPFLYVYNPPIRGRGMSFGKDGKGTMFRVELVGLIAAELHDIRYTHAEDGKPYEHQFETKTRAWAAIEQPTGKHVVVLRGDSNGNMNVWEDR